MTASVFIIQYAQIGLFVVGDSVQEILQLANSSLLIISDLRFVSGSRQLTIC